MSSRTSILVVCVAVLATGCAVVAPLPPPTGAPGPALAVAPVLLAVQPTADRPIHTDVAPFARAVCVSCNEKQPAVKTVRERCAECGGTKGFRSVFVAPYVPRLEADQLGEDLVATLRKRGTFASVVRVEAKGEMSLKRTEVLLDASRKAQAEWLLELEVDELAVKLIGSNGWHVPKVVIFIVSAILIFPAIDPPNWFIPGEDYGVVTSGRWRLRDVETGDIRGEGRFDRELCRDSFAAFGLGGIPSREFFFAGFLRVPQCLGEEDWREIGAQLESNAKIGLLRALVAAAEDRRKPKS